MFIARAMGVWSVAAAIVFAGQDRTGRTRTEAIFVEGAPGFAVFDDAGAVTWTAPVTPKGIPTDAE